MARHYLDHASTSPLRPEAADAVARCFAEQLGDPGRIHHEGMVARALVEDARAKVAALLGARPREIVFTSGATEAIAAAVHGAASRGRHLVVPAVEHSAVRLAADALAAAGSHAVTIVGADATGRVDPDEVAAAIRPDTALVCVQAANHEVGTRQDVAGVVAAARDREVLTMVDATAAVGRDDVSFSDWDVDLLACGAHKFGGPLGIGVLAVRRGLRLPPLLRGGDQERARRAGMENVPAIVGLGRVAELLADAPTRHAEEREQRRLTDRVLALAASLPGVEIHGDPTDRIAHIVCLGTRGVEPQAVLLGLDQAGIAAHSGSACSSESLEPSPVLAAMGVDAHHSLRISVGWSSTDADIDALAVALPDVLARLRALAG